MSSNFNTLITKKTSQEDKRQAIECEQLFVNYTYNKELLSRIYKELQPPTKESMQFN